jgi:hypothetical protein
LRSLLDELDARFFPLRNKPSEKAAKGVTEALDELTKRLKSLLSESLAATSKLEQRAANGEPREPLEKQYAALKRDVKMVPATKTRQAANYPDLVAGTFCGSPISSRRRGSIGIGITASLRPITSSGPPSLRSRSATSASGKRL